MISDKIHTSNNSCHLVRTNILNNHLHIYLHIDNRDESLDIEEAGGLIRSTDDLSPTCGTKEYYSVGVEKKCLDPICGSELHQSIGLETKCIKPVCNSSDHEAVGLDKECLYICNSEEHISQGLEFSCRVPINSNTLATCQDLAYMFFT